MQVATIFGFLRQCGIVETGTCYLIRKLGFQKLQELPFSYYDRMPVGYLMSRLTNDTQRLADTIGWSLVDLCWGAVYLVACAVRMLTINWRLGLIVMLVLPPLAVISWKFQKAILAAYRQVRKNNSQITAGFNEGINGDTTGGMLARISRKRGTGKGRAASVSLALAMIRVLTGISIMWFLLPGYALSLALSFVVPKIFTSIAFDSGGVASGPMTATFLLPFAMGACDAVGGNVVTDAFGVVAMVAMTPLVTIQLLGVSYKRRIKHVAPAAVAQVEEIIELA